MTTTSNGQARPIRQFSNRPMTFESNRISKLCGSLRWTTSMLRWWRLELFSLPHQVIVQQLQLILQVNRHISILLKIFTTHTLQTLFSSATTSNWRYNVIVNRYPGTKLKLIKFHFKKIAKKLQEIILLQPVDHGSSIDHFKITSTNPSTSKVPSTPGSSAQLWPKTKHLVMDSVTSPPCSANMQSFYVTTTTTANETK